MGSFARAVLVAGTVVALALASPALAAKRVALVIGNADYDNVGNLANPARDAAAVAASFERLGFATVRLERDLDYSAFRRALATFAREADGAEIGVVYYAGHGIEVGGENFLIPVDADLRAPRDVEFEAMPLDHVMSALEGVLKLRIVILDACRDNPFLSRMDGGGATRSVGRGLARVAPGANTLVAYAAKEGTTADDGDGRHSPYAQALLDHLETPGLEIGFLFRRVRDAVLSTTDGRQEPFVYGSLAGEAFYLKQGAGAEADVALVTPPPRPLTCRAIADDWLQMDKRDGRITRQGDGYLLRGAAWTNGQVKDGKLDGNGVISKQAFDFAKGGAVSIVFTVDGGGNYMAVFPHIIAGTNSVHISTRNSWAGSPVVPDGLRLFARALVEPDGDYLLTVSQRDFDGPSLVRAEGKLQQTKARVQLAFADNYAGPRASIVLEEAEVCLP